MAYEHILAYYRAALYGYNPNVSGSLALDRIRYYSGPAVWGEVNPA